MPPAAAAPNAASSGRAGETAESTKLGVHLVDERGLDQAVRSRPAQHAHRGFMGNRGAVGSLLGQRLILVHHGEQTRSEVERLCAPAIGVARAVELFVMVGRGERGPSRGILAKREVI